MIERSRVTKGWYSTTYSPRLSGRRARDTQPELVLRKNLHARGLRYRIHYRIAPRLRVDIAFPRRKIAVWVDGCFWHGCPEHGRRNFDGPNAANWQMKMQKNQARDERAVQEAARSGWKTLRLWECKVLEDPNATAEKVLALLVEP